MPRQVLFAGLSGANLIHDVGYLDMATARIAGSQSILLKKVSSTIDACPTFRGHDLLLEYQLGYFV